jgi:8-oxo-dGTP diphosphatase
MRDAGRAVRPEVAVGGIAFDAHGRVLLVQRGNPPSAGFWTVPGGRVEPGETLDAACRREMHEETGLEVRVGALVEVVERIVRDDGGALRYHFVILDYVVEVVGGALTPASDARDARWCEDAELERLARIDALTDGLLPVIERARGLLGTQLADHDGSSRR